MTVRGVTDGAADRTRPLPDGGGMGEVLDLAAARARRGPRLERRLRKAEVAAHFAVSERTITRWMGAGMPFEKPFENGAVRFVLSECEAWARRVR